MKKCPLNKFKPCIGLECEWALNIWKDKNRDNEPEVVCSIKYGALKTEQVVTRMIGIQEVAESSRNESVKRQDMALKMASTKLVKGV